MRNNSARSLAKGINLILESVEFIALSYLLLSAMFSFKTTAMYILFFAINVVVIQRFWVSLKQTSIGNIAVGAVFVICIAAIAGLFFTQGYISMSIAPVTTLKM